MHFSRVDLICTSLNCDSLRESLHIDDEITRNNAIFRVISSSTCKDSLEESNFRKMHILTSKSNLPSRCTVSVLLKKLQTSIRRAIFFFFFWDLRIRILTRLLYSLPLFFPVLVTFFRQHLNNHEYFFRFF